MLLGSCRSHAFPSDTSSVLRFSDVRKGYFLAPHKALSLHLKSLVFSYYYQTSTVPESK